MSPALALYLAATARTEPFLRRRLRRTAAGCSDTQDTVQHTRADGSSAQRAGDEVLWIHLAQPEGQQGAELVSARLGVERPGLRVVATCDCPPLAQYPGGLRWLARPLDAPRSADAFLATCRPSAALWVGAPIRPALVVRARRAGVPMILADAGADAAESFRGVPARDLVAQFAHVVARSSAAASFLSPLRRRNGGVSAVGRLQRGVLPPPCDQNVRTQFSAALKARPVWLALGVEAAELAAVHQAHAEAQRSSHRLLLVLRPADEGQTETAVGSLAGAGAGIPRRSSTPLPPEGASTFMADLPDEDGLWLHLAPVTFIGGTLDGRGPAIDPFAPASLGSAVLHGPDIGDMAANFRALADADAACLVASGQELGVAVSELQAPDRTAAMAARAWNVVSEGAEITDTVVGLLCDILDQVGV